MIEGRTSEARRWLQAGAPMGDAFIDWSFEDAFLYGRDHLHHQGLLGTAAPTLPLSPGTMTRQRRRAEARAAAKR